jgi:hypothetical protein
MKRILIGLVACGAVACAGEQNKESQENRIEANSIAQSMHIAYYSTERAGDSRLIHLHGIRDVWVGTVELTPLQVGEMGLDDFVQTAELKAREEQIRIRFRNEMKDVEIGLIRGKEKPGVDCPTNPPAPRIHAQLGQWAAALTDPALAPFLAELTLVVELNTDPMEGEGEEVSFSGTCAGHRVNDLGGGFYYQDGNCSTNAEHQTINYYADFDPYWSAYAYRDCWGSSAEGGNGYLYAGWQSCCNNSCPNPNPSSGMSIKEDCQDNIGAAGCKSTGGPYYSCQSAYCNGACYDNCGNWTGCGACY